MLIRQYVVSCDVHPFVKGATWQEVWADRLGGAIKGQPAFFASLPALIRMKEAAGRPKDLEDLKYLRRLQSGGSGAEPPSA